ncbi:hypothetical protein CEXT_641991 [Caerostris extrusa]|uniref:Uncharacterized protein n=1 Tax=Caerostris extrusa TaxID=172846 RepID=A0AAV4Q3V8_CAEEX|nr:hypothetical protein CEXT_641991 [Caerostris extrusa]
MGPSGSSKCASCFLVTVRKTGNRVGKENRKKTLFHFLSPRRSAAALWLIFFRFYSRDKKNFNNRCPFRKKKKKSEET